MTDLAAFLLARIAEDERLAREAPGGVTLAPRDWRQLQFQQVWKPARVLAECEAKRQIVERESRWRRTKDNVSGETRKPPDDTVTVTWMDDQYRPHEEHVSQAEFYDRFTEPSPPSETLKLLALPYAGHPDYREEWRP